MNDKNDTNDVAFEAIPGIDASPKNNLLPRDQAIAPQQNRGGTSMSVHPGVMISALVESHKEIDLAQMTGLFELQKKYEDEQARKDYFTARAMFSGMIPTITHDGKVDFKNTRYSFASLGGTMDQIRAALQQCGLTVSWKLEEAGNDIKVTCFLTHERGYQEETSLSAPRSAGVGATGMNVLQGTKSTVSYLERITLYALAGLSSKADDDDGAAGDPGLSKENVERVTANQAADLEALFTEVGGDASPILNFFHATDWADIPALDYRRVLNKLEARRSAGAESAAK